jgi:hypothetical protein
VIEQRYAPQPQTPQRCGLRTAATPPAWSRFKPIFADHWDGFKRVSPRYDRRYSDGLGAKRLGCGTPDQMGDSDSRGLRGGEGTQRVAMSWKSSLCLRCATVSVDTWGSQGSPMLHAGLISRHIVRTVPAILRPTFYQQSQELLSPCMRCGGTGLEDVLSRGSGQTRKAGSIVVLQTHGRTGQYHAHLQGMAPSGGGDAEAKQWRHLDYVPYPMWRQQWPWPLLTLLRQTVTRKESQG